MLVSRSGLSQGFLHALYCRNLELNVNRRRDPLATSTLHTACAEKHFSAVLLCKVRAISHTDKICCEELMERLHFADLHDGQPDYMVYLIRTVQALGVLVNSVCMSLQQLISLCNCGYLATSSCPMAFLTCSGMTD